MKLIPSLKIILFLISISSCKSYDNKNVKFDESNIETNLIDGVNKIGFNIKQKTKSPLQNQNKVFEKHFKLIEEKLHEPKIKNEFLKIFKIKNEALFKLNPSIPEHISIIKLICIQSYELPKINKELDLNGKKKTHWIWYVYTTQKPGVNDINKVFIENYCMLYLEILPKKIYQNWINILYKINNNFDSNISYIPKIDHDRLSYFCKLWLNILSKNISNNIAKKRLLKIQQLSSKLQSILDKYGIST